MYPLPTMTVSPANTMVRPSLQPYAIPSVLLATTLTMTLRIRPIFADMSSCTADGTDDSLAVCPSISA